MAKIKNHWLLKFYAFLTPKMLALWLLSMPFIIIYLEYFHEEINDLPIIDEYYAYHSEDTIIRRAILVTDEDNLERLNEYREIVYKGLDPKDNDIYMDTMTIQTTAKIGLLKYLNDSTIALIRFKNPWFDLKRRESNRNSKMKHGYISVSDLHKLQ